MKDRFFHLTMAVASLAIVTVTVFGLHARRIGVEARQFVPILSVLAFLLAGAVFYNWRRADKLANVFAMTFWAALFSNLHLLPICVVARAPVEMSDGVLAGVDRAMRLEVPDILRAVRAMPWLEEGLAICYSTLLLLMTLAVVLPPLLDRMSAAKEYAVACVVAAVIGISAFGLVQAVGPWTHYQYEPTPAQENYAKVFAEHKRPGEFAFDITYRDGLITFPSFHTILAVLAAAALWSFRHLRWPAAVLAALIVVSTVTTGWHYVSDVAAGLAVAAVSVAAAKGYTRLERRVARAVAASAEARDADGATEPSESREAVLMS